MMGLISFVAGLLAGALELCKAAYASMFIGLSAVVRAFLFEFIDRFSFSVAYMYAST